MPTLNSKVFDTEADRNTLIHLLSTLDHINPVYISRQKYDSKKWNILESTWETNKQWDIYNLYLPKDLKVWEQIYIINLLVTTFNLNNQELDKLLTYTKIMVWIILRINTATWMQELEAEARKYNIPDDFVEKVKNYKLWWQVMKFWVAKEFINQIKLKRWKKEDKNAKLWKSKDDKRISKNKPALK